MMYAPSHFMETVPKDNGEASFLIMGDIQEDHRKIDSSPLEFMDDFWTDNLRKPSISHHVVDTKMRKETQAHVLPPSSPKPHDSGKPRPPKSAFEVFVQYEKGLVEDKLRGDGKQIEPNDAAVMETLKEQWKGMQGWQKDVYKQLAEGDRKRYKNELRQWNANCQRSRGQVGEYLRSVLVAPLFPNLQLPRIVQTKSNISIPPVEIGKRAAFFDDAQTSTGHWLPKS